ncbi:MAG: 50S ribosomal protein L16 [Candidatus Hodarchaeota archaeon]
MVKRPAYCYSRIDRPPYTRKKFIKGGPEPKIRIFDLGSANKEFPVQLSLIALERCQISHNALEAARVHVNRYLTNRLGRENYHMRIVPYPHHYIRENRMMTGAGADRLQDGMRRAFGKPIGTVARVEIDQCLIFVKTNPNMVETAKEALQRGRHKFPCPSKIIVEKGAELLR